MNEDKRVCLKAVMINSTRRNALIEEEKELFFDMLKDKTTDSFSIMSIAMMINNYMKPDNYEGKDGICFNYCVNTPLKAAETINRKIVNGLDEYFEHVRRYSLKILKNNGRVEN